MNHHVLNTFRTEMEKEASLGTLGARITQIAAKDIGKATTRFSTRFRRKFQVGAQRYFPTASNISKQVARGAAGAAGTVGIGAVGIGGYGLYKGLQQPPPMDMTGY
jgi:hypothetical protein